MFVDRRRVVALTVPLVTKVSSSRHGRALHRARCSTPPFRFLTVRRLFPPRLLLIKLRAMFSAAGAISLRQLRGDTKGLRKAEPTTATPRGEQSADKR